VGKVASPEYGGDEGGVQAGSVGEEGVGVYFKKDILFFILD
jgi:hypothetical protein